ncbi:MAG: hypothetical protein WBE51_08685, partial [Xanthobacteraceae bacterium]
MSGAKKRNSGHPLPWLTGPIVKTVGAAKAGLHWAFGDAGPTDSANESIRRHIIAGSILVG